MDLEDKKENIVPLRGGRNVEQLESAFVAPERWEEERKVHEEEIENYTGDDPLLPWFNYFAWIEQTNVSNFKPTITEQALRRCVQLFENDSRYSQDHRFIKLCIKYIDAQPSPVELYNELYNRGVGTLCSELYIAWAYYYDAVDNFSKTEEVFQKGIRAGAEPKADLEQAHRTFGFSMSQRLLHKDDCSKAKFQAILDERRTALTSLRKSHKRHVGSIRTGLAVKSHQPGVVNQENKPPNGNDTNAAKNAIIFTDDAVTSESGASIVRPFSSVHHEPENIIEVARLAKMKPATNKKPLFGSHHSPTFNIPMDEEHFESIPILEENFTRGIVLPARFCRQNRPQTPFNVSICIGDPNERAIPMYDKIRLYCRADTRRIAARERTDFSPEELRAYGYFTRHGIENRFTQEHAMVWGRGYEIGIRLHPLHVSEGKCIASEVGESFKNPTLEECDANIQTKLPKMFPRPGDEKSIEELLVENWQAGKMKRCIDRRYQDDIDPVDMDETIVESKRISMGPVRFSMMPPPTPAEGNNPPPPTRWRKSTHLPSNHPGCVASRIEEETEEEMRNRSSFKDEKTTDTSVDPSRPSCLAATQQGKDISSRKRSSGEQIQQEVSKKEDFKPTPLKSLIVRGDDGERNEELPKPDSPVPTSSGKIPIFVDDSDENDERDEGQPLPKPSLLLAPESQQQQPYYPNDTCSTQMFNLFVKNISTPVAANRKQPVEWPIGSTAKQMVVFTDDEETETGTDDRAKSEPVSIRPAGAHVPGSGAVVNDENAVPVESTTPPSTSSGCNSTQSHKQLSTIMERTETSTTSSSVAVCNTKSSADSRDHSPDVNLTAACSEGRFPPAPEIITFPAMPESMDPPKPPALNLPKDDGKGFCIHIDSTETMANIPLKRQPLPAPAVATTTDNKENELVTRATGPAGRAGIFQLSEDPTCSGFGFAGTMGHRNVSHLVQREMEAHSIASFRLATERTNTVPLQLVKPQHTIPELVTGPSNGPDGSVAKEDERENSKQSPKKNASLLNLLDATFSPKAVIGGGKENGKGATSEDVETRKECSFDLDDFIRTPVAKNPPAPALPTSFLSPLASTGPRPVCTDLSFGPMDQIKMEPSLNFDASLALPRLPVPEMPKAITKPTQPVERVVLDEFPSPLPPPALRGRTSFEDVNTAVFSFNINSAFNSTAVNQEEFKTPKKPTVFENPEQPFRIAEVQGGLSRTDNFLMPPAMPHHRPQMTIGGQQRQSTTTAMGAKQPTINAFYENEANVSIYHPRPAISQDVERWDEIDEHFDSQQNNEYRHKSIDMDGTMQQINSYVMVEDIDPFDRQLLEAFLDRLEFLNYISELPSCLLVNKVQPLKMDVPLQVGTKEDEAAEFKVLQKIGTGSYGTIYCAIDVSTGRKVALKQERPANLWEYYICLELRSRIKNPDILPGFMPIEYAIIGNNASIFVSPYSRYGTILDVCNMVNKATNRNVDEFITMILSAQILSIVDHLHSCHIIHADIKPDNFLIMGPLQLTSSVPCVQLIDFGVSIDMKLFEKDIKFKKVITTEGFTCIEMMEGKQWTYQPDLFGVAATSHVMLFGKYMQVQKNLVNWGIKAPMPRYFKKPVWENYFTTLLNIRDCEHLPNLQQLRTAFMEEVTLHEKYIQNKVNEFNQVLAACK